LEKGATCPFGQDVTQTGFSWQFSGLTLALSILDYRYRANFNVLAPSTFFQVRSIKKGEYEMKGLVFKRSQFGKASAGQQPEWLVDLLVMGTMALLLAVVILVARLINNDAPAAQVSPASSEPVGLIAAGQSLPAVKALPPMGTTYLYRPEALQALAAESAVATGLAISPVSEAERFNQEWYATHLASARGDPAAVAKSAAASSSALVPPTGTSYLSRPEALQALAAESAVATGLAISPVTEAARFNREWYEEHLSQFHAQPVVTSGLAISPVTEAERFNREWYLAHTEKFHALPLRPALDTNQGIYTDRYWEMAKNRSDGTSIAGEYATYTDRYWRMAGEDDRLEPVTPGRIIYNRQNRTERR
jgi:hypothetical protein